MFIGATATGLNLWRITAETGDYWYIIRIGYSMESLSLGKQYIIPIVGKSN